MANHGCSMADLTARAESYCAMAEHCPMELRVKLSQWGADPRQTDTILAHLCADGFIDEVRYCAAFVHDKLLYQGWGRVKMRAALQAKRLPSDAIDRALSGIDEAEYDRILQRVILKKKSALPEQVVCFCLQRGFTLSEVRRFVSWP